MTMELYLDGRDEECNFGYNTSEEGECGVKGKGV